jgi:hypothetical protein
LFNTQRIVLELFRGRSQETGLRRPEDSKKPFPSSLPNTLFLNIRVGIPKQLGLLIMFSPGAVDYGVGKY